MAARKAPQPGGKLSPAVQRLIAKRDRAYADLIAARQRKEAAKVVLANLNSQIIKAGAPLELLEHSRCW